MSRKSVKRAAKETLGYGEEVIGHKVEILFQTGDGSYQFYLGKVTRRRTNELWDPSTGSFVISSEHFIVFDDGDRLWFNLAVEEKQNRLRWVHTRPARKKQSRVVQEPAEETTATTATQEAMETSHDEDEASMAYQSEPNGTVPNHAADKGNSRLTMGVEASRGATKGENLSPDAELHVNKEESVAVNASREDMVDEGASSSDQEESGEEQGDASSASSSQEEIDTVQVEEEDEKEEGGDDGGGEELSRSPLDTQKAADASVDARDCDSFPRDANDEEDDSKPDNATDAGTIGVEPEGKVNDESGPAKAGEVVDGDSVPHSIAWVTSSGRAVTEDHSRGCVLM